MKNLREEVQIRIQPIAESCVDTRNIRLHILRLDEIDEEVPGNKLFKLQQFLEEAIVQKIKIITFGGAWSNHLAATAEMCKRKNIDCIGIVRGEKPNTLSHTLSYCEARGMELVFISRENYKNKTGPGFLSGLKEKYGNHILIPEGGYGKPGVAGAATIASYYQSRDYTHICCAVGTATTLAGLITRAAPDTRFVGFNALKGSGDFDERMSYLLSDHSTMDFSIINHFNFGGFAKKTPELLEFMNQFYRKHLIPTDFVYTGKMMYGIYSMISHGDFENGSNILCIHTGGLQGNRSLPAGTFCF